MAFSEPQSRTDSDRQPAPTQLSIFRNVRDATIYGGSFSITNVQTICRNHGMQDATNQPTVFAFSPVGTSDDIVPHGVGGSQALYSLFSKIRRVMCNLPAPHLALARDCASLVRSRTTSRDLGRNIVCVVAPCFASYLFSIPAVVTYIWASTVVSHFLYPLGLDYKQRPIAQVTVVDALGNSLIFPWGACESITTFHEQYLKCSRNQPGFLFVKTKSYDVRYNGYILQQTDWKSIQPFTELYVDFVIIQREGAGVMCPWCKTVHSSPEGPAGDICTCSQCGRDFSVMNSLSAGSGNVPVDDLSHQRSSLPEEILRVRVKFQLSGRMPMGPAHATNSSPKVPSSDSALALPMGLSANISQSSSNEPFTTPVQAGTLTDYEEDEVLHPTTTPQIRLPTKEDEQPEDDAAFRDQDAQVIGDVDHEEKPRTVSGDIAEETRLLPEVDRRAQQTSQTSSASNPVHQVQMSDQDRSTYKQGISPTLSSPRSSQALVPSIVVFGQTGAGKSSLINLLAGKEIAKVSSQAAGCTSTIQEYRIQSDVGDIYKVWDTPGLNEGNEGRVSAQETFKQLYNLIKRSDINLIIYCIRGSRFTDMARVNYDLFYGIMCECRVPIVLVVTGLELEHEMDRWWSRNVGFIERMGMTFEGYACVTTTKSGGGIYEDKFRVSQDRAWALLKEHGNRVSWTPGQKWLTEVPHKMDAYMKEYSLRTGQERKLIPMVDRRAQRQAKQSLSAFDPSKSLMNHNVIIFGESGSGKSSLVNMIVGQDVARVSNSPMGCTFETDSYETRIDGTPYHIYDTVGLNEGEAGRVPHWKAIQMLYTLIRKLDGVSLLIFCVRGRIKDIAHANWLFFFDAICDKNVPVIVVSTCWEHEDNLEGAETQVWNALKMYSMVPKAVACVVSIWGRNNEHEEKYTLSQQKLRSLIVKCRMQEPWCKDKDEWFAQLYQKTYDLKLCLFAKSRLQFVERIRGSFKEFKRNGNLKESDMDILTKNLLQAEKRITKRRF